MPAVLDRLKDVLGKLTPERTPAQLALVEIQEQLDRVNLFTPERMPRVAALLEGPEELQCEVAIEAMRQFADRTGDPLWWAVLLPRLMSLLLARKLPFTAQPATELVRAAAATRDLRSLGLG